MPSVDRPWWSSPRPLAFSHLAQDECCLRATHDDSLEIGCHTVEALSCRCGCVVGDEGSAKLWAEIHQTPRSWRAE